MKLLEAVMGLFILIIALTVGFRILSRSDFGMREYATTIQADTEKLNIYNYSNYLLSGLSIAQTGYIFYSGNNYFTGSTKKYFTGNNYYYNCKKQSGKLINIDTLYTGIFCQINIQNSKIYNYKLLK